MTLIFHEAITVRHDRLFTPLAFTWAGRQHRVVWVANRWRVDIEWWRRRVWREYFKLATHTGLLVVFRDLVDGEWYLQRLYD